MPHRTARAVCVAIVLLCTTLVSAQPAARAAPRDDRTFTVNDIADDPAGGPKTDGVCETALGNGRCTLRAAITEGNHWHLGAVTIILPPLIAPKEYFLTIPPTGDDGEDSGDLNIENDMTIQGAGAAASIIEAAGMVPGDRVLSVTAGVSVTVMGVTIQGGQASSPAGFQGGGIYNSGSLTLVRTTVSGNRGNIGGGIYNASTLTLNSSTVSSNQAEIGGGIDDDTATLILLGSTVSGNHAFNVSGGGGLYNTCADAEVINSTISSNASDGVGGGVENTFAVCGNTLGLYNATIADNTADVGHGGGGVDNESGSITFMQNTILSNNTLISSSFVPSDCNGTLTSFGYNLISSTADCAISGTTTGNLLNQFALLRPLGHYGGPTQTHALNLNSPAIDAGEPPSPGNTSGCLAELALPVTMDQRGAPRPAFGGHGFRCDIGAYELQQTVDLPLVRR